jgi:hypothetical protein
MILSVISSNFFPSSIATHFHKFTNIKIYSYPAFELPHIIQQKQGNLPPLIRIFLPCAATACWERKRRLKGLQSRDTRTTAALIGITNNSIIKVPRF